MAEKRLKKTLVWKMDGWMLSGQCFAVCLLISRGHSLSRGCSDLPLALFLPSHLFGFCPFFFLNGFEGKDKKNAAVGFIQPNASDLKPSAFPLVLKATH